jgi:hypothetical protein
MYSGIRASIIAVLLIAFATAASAAPSDTCSMVRSALTKLSQAEHQQALALDLYAKGKSLPAVEVALTNMTLQIENLKRVLEAASTDGNPDAVECVAMGERALTQAQRLTAVVETVVLKGRGLPVPPNPAG